jgi:hypothetical protein
VQPLHHSAAGDLAKRLRALRRQEWPDLRITQDMLATALGGDGSLSVATISSYESTTIPKLPPPDRLAAYATFFASRRSVEGAVPRLLDDSELTDEERERRDALLAELRTLRAAAIGRVEQLTHGAVRRMWQFPDGAPITMICAELPDRDKIPYADPADHDYVELLTYADLDSLIELHGHIRAENPSSEVYFRTVPNVRPDDLTGHVVVIGGVAWNDATGRLAEQIDLPVDQVNSAAGPDVFVTGAGRERVEYAPRVAHGGELIEDVGLLARAPNPNNSSRTLTICSGVHTRGVLGAVRSLTDAKLRNENEDYLISRFAEADAFGLLLRVHVYRGQTLTPDFRIPHTRLYEWPPTSQ